MTIIFEKIVPTACQIEELFKLLLSRVHNISHQVMPSYGEHSEFVNKHPYRVWYLMHKNNRYIGTVYLTYENSIGINTNDDLIDGLLLRIIDKIKSEFEPLPPIKSIRANHFSINVSPSNRAMILALDENNYQIAQITYQV